MNEQHTADAYDAATDLKADYQTAEAAASRYIKIGAGGEQLPIDATTWSAVLGTRTGLMWSVEESPKMTQPKCVEYARDLGAAGFSDWQLPTLAQLETLRDVTRYSPAIDTAYFPGCKSDWYWTSTPAAGSPGYCCAWFVDFGDGGAGWYYHGGNGFVRAVRVGQSLGLG